MDKLKMTQVFKSKVETFRLDEFSEEEMKFLRFHQKSVYSHMDQPDQKCMSNYWFLPNGKRGTQMEYTVMSSICDITGQVSLQGFISLSQKNKNPERYDKFTRRLMKILICIALNRPIHSCDLYTNQIKVTNIPCEEVVFPIESSFKTFISLGTTLQNDNKDNDDDCCGFHPIYTTIPSKFTHHTLDLFIDTRGGNKCASWLGHRVIRRGGDMIQTSIMSGDIPNISTYNECYDITGGLILGDRSCGKTSMMYTRCLHDSSVLGKRVLFVASPRDVYNFERIKSLKHLVDMEQDVQFHWFHGNIDHDIKFHVVSNSILKRQSKFQKELLFRDDWDVIVVDDIGTIQPETLFGRMLRVIKCSTMWLLDYQCSHETWMSAITYLRLRQSLEGLDVNDSHTVGMVRSMLVYQCKNGLLYDDLPSTPIPPPLSIIRAPTGENFPFAQMFVALSCMVDNYIHPFQTRLIQIISKLESGFCLEKDYVYEELLECSNRYRPGGRLSIRFPHKYTDLSTTEISTGSTEPEICMICMDSVFKSVVNNCMHQFCFKCIRDWNKINSSCPLCKKDYTSDFKRVVSPLSPSPSPLSSSCTSTRKRRRSYSYGEIGEEINCMKKMKNMMDSDRDDETGYETAYIDNNGRMEIICGYIRETGLPRGDTLSDTVLVVTNWSEHLDLYLNVMNILFTSNNVCVVPHITKSKLSGFSKIVKDMKRCDIVVTTSSNLEYFRHERFHHIIMMDTDGGKIECLDTIYRCFRNCYCKTFVTSTSGLGNSMVDLVRDVNDVSELKIPLLLLERYHKTLSR